MLRVGDKLYGFCGGEFGRDSYHDKRVEAIGADWVVAREDNGEVVFAWGKNVEANLEQYKTPPKDE